MEQNLPRSVVVSSLITCLKLPFLCGFYIHSTSEPLSSRQQQRYNRHRLTTRQYIPTTRIEFENQLFAGKFVYEPGRTRN
jgi:hypothetical protein